MTAAIDAGAAQSPPLLTPDELARRDYATTGDGLPDELGCLRLLKAFWEHVHASLRDGHQRTMQWVESDDFLDWCKRGVMVDPDEVRPILRKTYADGRNRRKAELRELMDGQGGLPDCPDDAQLEALLDDYADTELVQDDDGTFRPALELPETLNAPAEPPPTSWHAHRAYGLEWRYQSLLAAD